MPTLVEGGRACGDVAAELAAAERTPNPIRASLEAIVALAETDPVAARETLWRLQADWPTLERLERQVGGNPAQAGLRIGAAIHLARAELASPTPHLRQMLPELLELLGS